MEFSANSRDKICNGRCRPSTNSRSHRSDTDLERPLFLLHKIEPTARRSSFADQTMRDAGRWMMARIEHVVRSAQNVTASGHNVRSERSPLHDVRQHAHARAPRGARMHARIHFRMSRWLIHGRDRSWLASRSSWLPARLRPSGSGVAAFVSLHERRLVEPDGIEPTTSCLQSRRSPN